MKSKILLQLLVGLALLAVPAGAQAKELFGVCSNAGTDTSATCTDKSSANPISGTDGLILNIANIIALIAGAAAVIIIVISGIKFITSGGDASKAKNARETLFGALIGIAVIVLARVLIGLVLSKLN